MSGGYGSWGGIAPPDPRIRTTKAFHPRQFVFRSNVRAKTDTHLTGTTLRCTLSMVEMHSLCNMSGDCCRISFSRGTNDRPLSLENRRFIHFQ